MHVSVELIGVVLTGFGVVITLGLGMLSGFGWMARRIDRVDDKLSARIDGLSARIDGVETELTEVKIGIARLEGPRPHLIVGR
ncbi:MULTISPECIES: hypothetical protein [unclassified Microbacterium]|uniref:hypothetical protein n=1 Tax=unclassified Microbacterium TaxID=2609290 RepID=UPI00203D21D6|nr:hypothetical protein [Microbacterium sp. USTB-Y]